MQTTHGGPATPSSPAEPDAKPALRQLYRDRRRAHVQALTPAAREAAERALARHAPVLASLYGRDAGPVASYAGIADELDPRWLEAALGAHAFPRIEGRELSFRMAAWADLVPGPLGIPQPRADAPEITPRWLLVPLLAVTRAGVRLGQGGGYYDRTLARLRSAGPVLAIGLAWDVQLAAFLPQDPHDQRLDLIATPTQLVDCRHTR